MILFILQNAYQNEKYSFTNEPEWHSELMRSHTGRRLKEMIPEGSDFKVINSTGEIGDNPDSYFKPDLIYMQNWIDKIKPDVICACGVSSQNACRQLGIKFIPAPHPAWRSLSKSMTEKVKKELCYG